MLWREAMGRMTALHWSSVNICHVGLILALVLL